MTTRLGLMTTKVLSLLFAAVLLIAGTPAIARQTTTNSPVIINNYDVTIELGRDQENRSILSTTESITMQFNDKTHHGLERSFVKNYDEHGTSFKLTSVTSEAGDNLPYTWVGDTLRVGSADELVTGQKTYVLKYTERDITKHFDDRDTDEFYRDVVGAYWPFPIEKVKVSLFVDEVLAYNISADKMACYQGTANSHATCNTERPSSNTFTTSATDLLPGEGITIAVPFTTGTFAAYKPTLLEKLLPYWIGLQIASIPISVILAIFLIVSTVRTTGRKRELDPIPPEYIPMPDTSVTVAAGIGSSYGLVLGSVMAAQLLDFAVRGYIKVYEREKKKFIGTNKQYEIHVVKNPSSLLAEERELLSDMFDGLPKPGDSMSLEELKYNRKYAIRTMDNDSKLKKLFEGEYALTEVNPEHQAKFKRRGAIITLLGVISITPALFVVGAIAWAAGNYAKSLTDKGLQLRRYLMGLRMYIKASEVERLAMLQSPSGAEKVSMKISELEDPKKLVKLYERVLPYAVLFGLEKDWGRALGAYYDNLDTSPDWYSGSNAFTTAAFVSGLSNISTSSNMASSYSNNGGGYSSSSGSFGGGSVGGGSGGGGGGAW